MKRVGSSGQSSISLDFIQHTNNMRVLVVEDEKRIADFLSRGLQSAGYAVDVADKGGDAIDRVHSTEYDLVVLDLGLPDIDGLQVLEKIKNRKIIPPVLILSARDSVDDRVKGLEQGADDYLVKPFAFVELLARARVLLRRGQPTPEKLQVGDLTLDCIRRKVMRNNENIELAPKEFSILEYMMRNRGRPLSRTMIVEHVWDMDYDGLTNIVDVYIRHLRSKIDDKFPAKMIHTVRGIGYMLDMPEAGQIQRPKQAYKANMLWKKPHQVRFFRTLRFRLASTFLLLLALVLAVVGFVGHHNLAQRFSRARANRCCTSNWDRLGDGFTLTKRSGEPYWFRDPSDPEEEAEVSRLQAVFVIADDQGRVDKGSSDPTLKQLFDRQHDSFRTGGDGTDARANHKDNHRH